MIRLSVLSIVVSPDVGGFKVTSVLDDDIDAILSGSMPPPLTSDFHAGRDVLYRTLVAHVKNGVDITDSKYQAGVLEVGNYLLTLRPPTHRWQ